MAAKKTVPVKKAKPAEPATPDAKAIAAKYATMSASDMCNLAKRGATPGCSEADWEALTRMADDFSRLAQAVA